MWSSPNSSFTTNHKEIQRGQNGSTHAVKDVGQWLAYRAKFVEAFAPYATDLVLYTIPEGGNNVAIAMNVHDMEGMWAATQTPEHQAMTDAAGIIHPPHAMYFEAAG